MPKGKGGYYAYYLCQTKGCDHYGKSMKRDKVEGDIGELVKTLQPTKQNVKFVTALSRYGWTHRSNQAKEIVKAGRNQIKTVEKQIEVLLSRILNATNENVIGSYESKISDLEKEKLILAEKLQKQAEPKGSFEDKLEPAVQFLTNPWKLWENGNIHLRRTVLKLAFTDCIPYDRFEGARTTKISLPFKALGMDSGGDILNGARGRI